MHNRIQLAVFPSILLGLCTLERISTYLLANNPANPEMWRLWFAFRPAGYLPSMGLDRLSGNDMPLQAGILALAAMTLIYALSHRKAVAIFFLANHLALIGTAAAVFLTMDADTASLASGGSGGDSISLLSDMRFSAIQATVTAFGLASCILCHFAFFADQRTKRAHAERQLTVLQRAL